MPPRLALALKPSRKTARVIVLQLTPGAGTAMGNTAKLLGQAEVASALPIQVSMLDGSSGAEHAASAVIVRITYRCRC